jgi:uncharacterized UPF0160 family protein
VTPKGHSLYIVNNVIGAFRPTRKESDPNDDTFMPEFKKVTDLAREIIEREIIHAKSSFEDARMVDEVYENTEDKRLIILDEPMSWKKSLISKSEPIYVIHPKFGSGYAVRALPESEEGFESRKPFPAEWRSKRGAELEKACGVEGAEFCHTTGYLLGAKNKEAAIEIAKIALAS